MQGRCSWQLGWLLRPSHVLLLMLALLLTGVWPSPSMATPVEGNKESGNETNGTNSDMKERVAKKDVGVVGNSVPTNISPGGLLQNESHPTILIGSGNTNGTNTSTQDPMLNASSLVKDAPTVPPATIPSNVSTTTKTTEAVTAETNATKIKTTTPVYTTTTKATMAASITTNTSSSPSSNSNTTIGAATAAPTSGAPAPSPSPTSVATTITTTSVSPSGPPFLRNSSIIHILDIICRNLSAASGITVDFEFKLDEPTIGFEVDIELIPDVSDEILKSFIRDLQNLTWDVRVDGGKIRANGSVPFLKGVFRKPLSSKLRIHLTPDGLKQFCDSAAFPDKPNATNTPSLAPSPIPNQRSQTKALNAFTFFLGSVFTVLVLGFILWACSKYCSDTSTAPVNWTSWSGIATNIAIRKSNVRAWFRDLRGGRQRTVARYSAQRDAETGLLESNFEQYDLI